MTASTNRKMSHTRKDDFSHWGCVVKAQFVGIEDEVSSCGIVFQPHNGIILCHGSIFTEICLKNEFMRRKILDRQKLNRSDVQGANFSIFLDKSWEKVQHRNQNDQHSLPLVTTTVNTSSYLQSATDFPVLHKSSFVGAFLNTDFHESMKKLMPEQNWTFKEAPSFNEDNKLRKTDQTNQERKDEIDNAVTFRLLSYFVLLRCNPLENSVLKTNPFRYYTPSHTASTAKEILDSRTSTGKLAHKNKGEYDKHLNKDFKKVIEIGDTVEVISTPFGSLNPAVFFNSYSRGVVSNVSGNRDCWILTDARCIPGSEGGPLFSIGNDKLRYITGVIVAALCWKNKEWVGFSVACSLGSIIHSLIEALSSSAVGVEGEKLTNDLQLPDFIPRNTIALHSRETFDVNSSIFWNVVMVNVGSTWGSGVIVDKQKGLILTCSHVIKDSSSLSVFVRPYRGTSSYKANVIYHRKSPSTGPFDVAVLSCQELASCIPALSYLRLSRANLGDAVFAIGHPLFGDDLNLDPSVSVGVISKVVKIEGRVVMVQTTCAIHAGASGGPVFNSENELIGIVVSNTVDKGSNSSYPHVNMCVPASIVKPTLTKYFETKDPSVFDTLVNANTLVRKMWTLDNSIPLTDENVPKSKL